jgi:hypothetical protein
MTSVFYRVTVTPTPNGSQLADSGCTQERTEMQTSSLIGEPLNLAVAQAMGRKDTDFGWWWDSFNPSTDWAHGGPIIEREKISCVYYGQWVASIPADGTGEALGYYGPTHLIAAMRCFVASKLGDTIDILKERT